MYRVNKYTGETSRIIENSVVPLKQFKMQPTQTIVTKDFVKSKDKKDIPVNIKTKWRNGQLLYAVNISSYSVMQNYRNNYGARIIPQWYDEDGIIVKKTIIPLDEMTNMASESLYYSGSLECNIEDYADIRYPSCAWSWGSR